MYLHNGRSLLVFVHILCAYLCSEYKASSEKFFIPKPPPPGKCSGTVLSSYISKLKATRSLVH